MIQRQKFLAATSAAAALAASTTLAAAHHPASPGNTGGAGPINTISANTLEQGRGVIGIVVDYTSLDALSDDVLERAALQAHEEGEDHAHVHSLDSITAPSLNFAYGITDDVTVAVRLPHVKRKGIREGHVHEHEGEDGEDGGHDEGAEAEVHNHGTSSGIGDLSLLGQWRFLNNQVSGTQMAVLLGFKAPTGKTDDRDSDGERFDAEFQPGSGSWDGLFGLAFTQRFGKISFDTSVLYTLVTEGVLDTDLGDRLSYGVALSYRLTGEPDSGPMFAGATHRHADGQMHVHDEPGSGPALDLIVELNGEWHDKQETGGERDHNSGGHTLYIAPGLRLSQDKWSAFASVGIPIVNDTNGIQSEADWRLVSGLTIGF